MGRNYHEAHSAVIAAIMRGVDPKRASVEAGMRPRYGNKAAWRHGLRARLVTDAEWRALLANRTQSHGMA